MTCAREDHSAKEHCRQDSGLEVTVVQVGTPNAVERLHRAFEIILRAAARGEVQGSNTIRNSGQNAAAEDQTNLLTNRISLPADNTEELPRK